MLSSIHKILPKRYKTLCLYVWLFVCLGFIVPFENFSIIWRRNHYRWRAASFVLCSALMAIEQWEFFIEPHLLWHGEGPPFIWLSLRTRDAFTYCRAFSSGTVPSCFYDLGLSRMRFEHPTFRLRATALTHCAIAVVFILLILLLLENDLYYSIIKNIFIQENPEFFF